MKKPFLMSLALPRPGSVAPDFQLTEVDGEAVRLSTAARPLGLVFMRHLA